MDFEPTAEQKEVQALARDFARQEIEPHAAEWDRDHHFPRDVFAKLAELGLMGRCVPEEYGGAGTDFLSYILVLEELSRADAGVGVTVAVHTSAATLPILTFGTDEQRARFVPPLARGEHLGAFALTEPESGSDAGALRTRAEPDGDGWKITGAKQWITNGALRRNVPPLRPHRLSTRRSARRLAPSSSTPTTSHITRDEEKLGLNSSTTNDLVVEGALVDRDRLLHDENKGFRGRDADARRRPDRDRRAGGRDRAGGLRRRARVREAAPDLRQAHRPSTRRSSSSSPTWRPRSTPPACSSTAPRR